MLLDLGSEAAWNYCFNTLSDMIKRLNVSVYRQDFNFSPLPYWRTRNTEGRVGITEIKHINGLYRLWDALLEKFPYLLIDNCASGGRRIDIETLRRSVPLWRSDAQCPADPEPELTQAHSLSHSQWMPYSGTGVGRIWFDTYRFRSAYAPALTTNFTFSEKNSFGDNPDEMAWLAKMCSEFVRVRPYLSEDYYKLTEPTDAHDVWSAIQYNRPNMGDGIVQIFRRDSSPYEEACFVLRGLDASKKYLFEDADGGELILDGKNLATDGFRVRVSEKRCAKLYFYKQI
jgi:alpha-galactosidase